MYGVDGSLIGIVTWRTGQPLNRINGEVLSTAAWMLSGFERGACRSAFDITRTIRRGEGQDSGRKQRRGKSNPRAFKR